MGQRGSKCNNTLIKKQQKTLLDMAPPLVLHSSLSNVFPTLPLTSPIAKTLPPPPFSWCLPPSHHLSLMDNPRPPLPTTNKGDHILKQLNKSSLKIAKPAPHVRKPPDPPPPPPTSTATATSTSSAQAQQLPPVYNINKNDFRDVVQKLTGIPPSRPTSSPPPPPPPPAFQPKPPVSRFHRFRPPPLSPPPVFAQPPPAPFSPLPPLPAVSAAAESPISAYLRFLHSSIAANPPFAIPPVPLFSPTGGQLGFPSSPGVSVSVPVPSPRWKDV